MDIDHFALLESFSLGARPDQSKTQQNSGCVSVCVFGGGGADCPSIALMWIALGVG